MQFLFFYAMIVLSAVKKGEEVEGKPTQRPRDVKMGKNVVMNKAFQLRKEKTDLNEIKEKMKVRKSFEISLKNCDDEMKENQKKLSKKIKQCRHNEDLSKISNTSNSSVLSIKMREYKRMNEEVRKLRREEIDLLFKKTELLNSKISNTKKIISLADYFVQNDKFFCKFNEQDMSFIKSLSKTVIELEKERDTENERLQVLLQDLENIIHAKEKDVSENIKQKITNKPIERVSSEITKKPGSFEKSSKNLNDTSGIVADAEKIEIIANLNNTSNCGLLEEEVFPEFPETLLSSTPKSSEYIEFLSAKQNIISKTPSVYKTDEPEHLSIASKPTLLQKSDVNPRSLYETTGDNLVNGISHIPNKTVFSNSYKFGENKEFCFEIKLKKREKNR